MKLKSFLKEKTPKLYESLRRIGIRILPLPLGLMIINFIVQRLFRINGRVKWMVHFTSYVSVSWRTQIGKEVWKSFASSGGCYIQGANGMIIGDYTIFAPGVKIISGNHDPSDMRKWLPAESLEIGRSLLDSRQCRYSTRGKTGRSLYCRCWRSGDKKFPCQEYSGRCSSQTGCH